MKNRVVSNALWIIFCRVAQSVLSLIVNMLTARYLGPSNFGLINYAMSLVAFVAPIMKLGLDGILVREIVQTPEREGEVLGTSFVMTLCSGAACMVGLGIFVSVANAGETETLIVCLLYSTILLAQSIELIQYWFQAKLLSKYVSLVSLAAYAVMSAYQIYLLATGKNVYWFAVAKVLDTLVIDVCLLLLYNKNGRGKLRFSWQLVKSMFAKGRYYIVSSMMVTIFAQTDRIMLKMMVDDAATGYYSAAVACAGMFNFVFAAIIDSMRPSILAHAKQDYALFEKDMSMLYSVIIYLALAQSVVITLFAPWMVQLLYGPEYVPAIDALRLIVWYTTFSYMGAVRNIWILAQGKEKVLWKINLSGALANVVLNFLLIPGMGIVGAALASLVTQIFTNVVTGYIFKDIRDTNRLMVQGLSIKNGLAMGRALKDQVIKKGRQQHATEE